MTLFQAVPLQFPPLCIHSAHLPYYLNYFFFHTICTLLSLVHNLPEPMPVEKKKLNH